MKLLFPVCLAVVVFALAGCSPDDRVSAPSSAAQQAVYQVKGVVRSISVEAQTIRVAHEEIPGYMAAMTMDFKVRQKADLGKVAAGDVIGFRLVVVRESHWIDQIAVIARGSGKEPAEGMAPTLGTRARFEELKVGDALPDFEFISENGDKVRPSQFRGKALAMTFFFSRCPLPDYCPRMSRNFSRARQSLVGSSNEISNWQMLSVSFDPEFDKPAVLARYAAGYREGETNHWLFAAAPEPVLAELAPQIDLMLHRDANGGISHNLRTLVVDAAGKVFRQFDGNDWTPDDLVNAMIEAAHADKQSAAQNERRSQDQPVK